MKLTREVRAVDRGPAVAAACPSSRRCGRELKATDIDEVVLVGGSTRMPMVQELVRKLTGGKEPNRG